MTKQEIYDKVKSHLLAQGRKSQMLKPGERTIGKFSNCAYRGEGGLKCALGCLIDDRFYKETLEGLDCGAVAVRVALRQSGIDDDADVGLLLSELQNVHDTGAPPHWGELLAEVAIRNELVP
jgi:hypothetical protein